MGAPASPHQPTVLIFDDEEDLRDVMCRMLQRRGFTVLAAADPAQAAAIVREHDGDIDVLVADLGMPDAIGVEVTRDVRAVRPNTRVLYVSGLPKDQAVRQRLLDESAVVVQKPFTTDGIVSAVRAALSEQAHASPG